MPKKTVQEHVLLVVCDDRDRYLLAEMFRKRGRRVTPLKSLDEAREYLRSCGEKNGPDLAVIDGECGPSAADFIAQCIGVNIGSVLLTDDDFPNISTAPRTGTTPFIVTSAILAAQKSVAYSAA